MNDSKVIQCDGACEDYVPSKHTGTVRKVRVWGHGTTKEGPWIFHYCDTAIVEDRERGFTVEEVVSEQ